MARMIDTLLTIPLNPGFAMSLVASHCVAGIAKVELIKQTTVPMLIGKDFPFMF